MVTGRHRVQSERTFHDVGITSLLCRRLPYLVPSPTTSNSVSMSEPQEPGLESSVSGCLEAEDSSPTLRICFLCFIRRFWNHVFTCASTTGAPTVHAGLSQGRRTEEPRVRNGVTIASHSDDLREATSLKLFPLIAQQSGSCQ